jgi:hypothetical protein
MSQLEGPPQLPITDQSSDKVWRNWLLNLYNRINSTVATSGGDLISTNNLSDVQSAAASRANLNVDIAGTDNSTDITLAGAGTYLSIAFDQVLTQDLITSDELVTTTTRVTTTYVILAADDVIFANTDAGAYTVTLPAGVQDKSHKVINTGTSNNLLTLAPDGAEDLLGANSGFLLYDGESLDITYDATEGWF